MKAQFIACLVIVILGLAFIGEHALINQEQVTDGLDPISGMAPTLLRLLREFSSFGHGHHRLPLLVCPICPIYGGTSGLNEQQL